MGVIGTIRKHSWVAVALVGIAIVAFIIGDLTKNNGGIPDMGKINGTTITSQHFNNRLTELEDGLKRQQGVDQIPSDVEYQLRDQLWQTMVSETLLGEEYDALGLTVSNDELSDMFAGQFIHPYVRQMFTNPQTGVFDINQVRNLINNFEQMDTNMRYQWVEMEEQIRNDRAAQKHAQLISQGFYMPKAMAAQIAQMGVKNSTANVVSLAYADMPDGDVTIEEADYETYYNKHKEEYRVYEELRDIDMVVFTATPTSEDMQTLEQEVRDAWDTLQTTSNEEIPYFVNSESDHSYDSTYIKSSSLTPALDSLIAPLGAGQYLSPRIVGNEWVMAKVINTAYRPDSLRASAIYILNQRAGGQITRSDDDAKLLADSVAALIRSGRSTFEQAVAQFSDDPQKGNNQGDQGWAVDGAYGFLNEDVVNNAVGSVFVKRHPSEVGYLVVMVTDKTPANKKYRLALITREIHPSEKTLRDVYAQANSFAASNRSIQEMQATAASQGMQVRQARLMAMTQNVNGIDNSRDIVQWAFNEKTEIGAVADKVFDSENSYVVVALRDVFKKGYATLDQTRMMMEQQVRIDKKAEALMAKASEAMKGANSIDAVAAKLGANIDTVSNVSFNGYFFGKFGMEPKMLGAIAAAADGKLVGPIKGAQGVYVAMPTASTTGEPEGLEMIQATFQQTYLQKARMINTDLKNRANIVDQRNKFF